MKLTTEQLKQILVGPEFISQADFDRLNQEAVKKNKDLTDLLLEFNLINDEQLGQLTAEFMGYSFVNLRKENIKDDVLWIIPEVVAERQGIISFAKDQSGLKLAMKDPTNLDLISLIQKKTGEKVIPYLATEKDLKENLGRYRKDIKVEFKDIIFADIEKAKKTENKDIPIIKIVETIIDYACQNKASDIHFEPTENKIIIRFRIDGVLHDILDLPKNIHDFIVARIKILSNLKTDEHQAAQDGRFGKKFGEEKVDIRVSVMPITKGEKIVLRLLSERTRRLVLEDLGLLERDLKIVKKNIERPWGMILATGPTGCGKTTTIYALLEILNKREINIATIEDPVEYDIEGINQIQVNPKTNLTFGEGLRALVRQDPDVLMVGEIRDKETAGISINAALTGHLVLSTVHTNDAPTTIIRLVDMDVEPFLIASTVNVIIAQRLVRLICRRCIVSQTVFSDELIKILGGTINLSEKYIKYFKEKEKLRIYNGVGCEVCHQTGYAGRIGIFEVLEMDEEMRELAMKTTHADQLRDLARKKGMTTMFEDGLEKVLRGVTTLEEILKATME